MGIPRKTMRDIKTLSGRVDRIANSYMAYMQITCLEMEKARKARERASVQARLENLNARLGEIDSEKSSLLRALSERGSHPAPGAIPTSAISGSRPASARSAGGLKLRY
jgi:hypothetical protein